MHSSGPFLPPDPVPWRAVDVLVPARAANDLKAMQEITAKVLGRLGCENCHSGFDLRFRHITRYVVDPETFDVREDLRGFGP